MWEEEPVGVDPKRPLVGFALVAVLCAVLMTLSVGRGWALDLFHPGKPIAASAAGGHLDRFAPAVAPPAEPAQMSIPAELSAQPLGVAAGGPVPAQSVTQQLPAVEDDAEAATTETTLVGKADRKADQVDRKADRRADKADRKDDRRADKADRTSDKAAQKAQRTADKAAEKLQRLADKAADRAARDAAKAERHAARLAGHLARSAQRAAEQAVKAAEKAARKG